MFDQVNNNTFKDLQNLIATKMKLTEASIRSKQLSSQEKMKMIDRNFSESPTEKYNRQMEQKKLDREQRDQWEKLNPDEAKRYRASEELAQERLNAQIDRRVGENEKRKQWWSNPENERKALEWDAKNPKPESGYAQIEWRRKRDEAGIMPREDTSSPLNIDMPKPWQQQYKPRPFN